MSDHWVRIDDGHAKCDADDFESFSPAEADAIYFAQRHLDGLGYDYEIVRDGLGPVIGVAPTWRRS